jgi:hypothetical protein
MVACFFRGPRQSSGSVSSDGLGRYAIALVVIAVNGAVGFVGSLLVGAIAEGLLAGQAAAADPLDFAANFQLERTFFSVYD